ncbi:cuticle protein-like [Macrobrachium nipponense]|uniref:cuticle protein-like n=1 Tax=Macrobrachium nipponense TaxID=159736 RepID=UPI0030C87CE9
MQSQVIIVLLGLVALVAADSREVYSYAAPRAPPASSEESFESSEAKYSFSWAVSDESSENDFGHQESRDGDDTQGSYYVQLPDGRLQKVSYHVDGDDGYMAEVTYEGEAQFPDSVESAEFVEAPRYAPPRPRYSAPDSNESK